MTLPADANARLRRFIQRMEPTGRFALALVGLSDSAAVEAFVYELEQLLGGGVQRVRGPDLKGKNPLAVLEGADTALCLTDLADMPPAAQAQLFQGLNVQRDALAQAVPQLWFVVLHREQWQRFERIAPDFADYASLRVREGPTPKAPFVPSFALPASRSVETPQALPASTAELALLDEALSAWRLDEAEDLLASARLSRSVPGPELLLREALLCSWLGEYGAAETILRTLLDARSVNASDRVQSLHILGTVLTQQGRYLEAEGLLRDALAINEKALDKEHPAYGASLHALAGVLQALGRPQEAEALLRDALAISEKALGKDHPSYGASLHTLATVVQALGRYEEAEGLLRDALAIKEKVLGKDHPSYGASLHELARALEAQGDYKEAEGLLRDVLAITENTLGKDHPSHGTSLHTLATVQQAQGRHLEAEGLLRNVLAITEKVLGKDHPSYGASLHELSTVVKAQGRAQEAESLLRDALAINEKALGKDHPNYGASLHKLAIVLQAQGRYLEAEGLLRDALAVVKKALGKDHPAYGASLISFSQLVARHDSAEGLRLGLQALAILRASLGEGHPNTQGTLRIVASLRRLTGQDDAGE